MPRARARLEGRGSDPLTAPPRPSPGSRSGGPTGPRRLRTPRWCTGKSNALRGVAEAGRAREERRQFRRFADGITHPPHDHRRRRALRRRTVLRQYGGPRLGLRSGTSPARSQVRAHALRIGDHRDELHAAAALGAPEHVDGRASRHFGFSPFSACVCIPAIVNGPAHCQHRRRSEATCSLTWPTRATCCSRTAKTWTSDSPPGWGSPAEYQHRHGEAVPAEGAAAQLWSYTTPQWAGRLLNQWTATVMRTRLEPFRAAARSFRAGRPTILDRFVRDPVRHGARQLSSDIQRGQSEVRRTPSVRAPAHREPPTLAHREHREARSVGTPPLSVRRDGRARGGPLAATSPRRACDDAPRHPSAVETSREPS